jgi:transcriptional regulator with XRE-family HTH domain
MERDGLSRADLARKLGKSRASVSQMFNKTPNLSIMKMMEIADAVDLDISLKEGRFLSSANYVTAKCESFYNVSEDFSNISSLSIGCGAQIIGKFTEENKEHTNAN